MHPEAYEFIRSCVAQLEPPPSMVLDIGGRNINGTVKDFFPKATFRALDILPGAGVDIIADAAHWQPTDTFDCILCCEVFEHAPNWPHILTTIKRAGYPGSCVIITAASEPRPPHSAIDGRNLEDGEYYSSGLDPHQVGAGEYYRNISPDLLQHEMELRFRWVRITTHPRGDVYGVAVI